MKEWEVETVVQRGLEKFPGKTPRLISDNGIRPGLQNVRTHQGMTHSAHCVESIRCLMEHVHHARPVVTSAFQEVIGGSR